MNQQTADNDPTRCDRCQYLTTEINRQQAHIRTLIKRIGLLRNLAGLPPYDNTA